MATAPSATASEVSRLVPCSVIADVKPEKSKPVGTGPTSTRLASGCRAVLIIQYSGNSMTARTTTPKTVAPQRRLGRWTAGAGAAGIWVVVAMPVTSPRCG